MENGIVDFIEANKKLQDIWEKERRHHPFMIKCADDYHLFLHKQDAHIPMYLFVASLRKEEGQSQHTLVTDILRPADVQSSLESWIINREQLTNGFWRPNIDGSWGVTAATLYTSYEWNGFAIPIETLSALSRFITLMNHDEVASVFEMIRTMSGHREDGEYSDTSILSFMRSFEFFNMAYTHAHSGLYSLGHILA